MAGMTRSIPTVRTRSTLLLLSITLLAGLFPRLGHGQEDGKQYLSAMLTSTTRKSATFYRTVEGRKEELYLGRTWSLDGRLKAEGTYTDETMLIEHGDFVFYHPNGQVESRGAYVMGNKSGVWERFDPSGKPMAEKVYDHEALLSIVHTRAEVMPCYRNGTDKDLNKYLRSRVAPTNERKVKGTITTTFVVEKDGRLTGVRVVEGKSDQIDQQVVDAILSTSPWTPGMEAGLPVRVRMHLPVRL